MTRDDTGEHCIAIDQLTAFASGDLPEHRAESFALHVAGCLHCDLALKLVERLAAVEPAWPRDVVQPRRHLWGRLAAKIAPAGSEPLCAGEHFAPAPWEEIAPGICCKLLAADCDSDRVSLMVRLHPGCDFPPHEHADAEELHLLDGELWINDRKLLPGDYHQAVAGTADWRVWSETGCTCVLITSLCDRLLPGAAH